MSTEVVAYEMSAPQRRDVSFDGADIGMQIQWRQRLVVIAPSEDIWANYAASIDYKLNDQYGANHVVTRGTQLLELGIPDPFVLVLGMPMDTELRLSVMGALGAMTETWEARGGRVVYVNWNPPPALARKAAYLARDEYAKRTKAEIIRDSTRRY